MDEEEIKAKVDINNVNACVIYDKNDKIEKTFDYITDLEGKPIIRVGVLDFKIIEYILDLEARIKKLEGS